MKQLIATIALVLGLAGSALASNSQSTITGNIEQADGSTCSSCRVYFQIPSTQSYGGSLISPKAFSVVTDSSGNLPSGTKLPYGALVNVSIGTGQPIQIHVPTQATVDLTTLILANTDPDALVSQIASGNAQCSVINPPLGSIGTATITCNLSGLPTGTIGQFMIEGASSAAFTTLTGDVTGSVVTPGDLTVVAIQGHAIASTAPTSAQLYIWSGSQLVPVSMSGDCTITTAGVITCTGSGSTPFGPFATATAPLAINLGGTHALTAGAAFSNLSPLTTLGDILYEDASPAGNRLAGNITSTKKFLTQTGTGVISAVPAWGTIVSSDLTTALTTPPPIGGTTPNSGNFTAIALVGASSGYVSLLVPAAAGTPVVTFNDVTGNALVADAVGPVKTKRITTGSISATTYADVDVTWTAAFADANYTVNCSVVESTSAAQGLDIDHIQQALAAKVTVTVHNPTGGSLTGTLNCTATHD